MSKRLTAKTSEFDEFRRMVGGPIVHLSAARSIELNSAYWDSGSKSTYAAFTADGGKLALPRHGGAPQFGGSVGVSVELGDLASDADVIAYDRPAFLVEFSIFQGKHMAPRVSMHPERFEAYAAKLTSNVPELTGAQRFALEVTSRHKSSYRLQAYTEKYLPSEYQPARDSLAELGLMTKRGAITPEGRNAIA